MAAAGLVCLHIVYVCIPYLFVYVMSSELRQGKSLFKWLWKFVDFIHVDNFVFTYLDSASYAKQYAIFRVARVGLFFINKKSFIIIYRGKFASVRKIRHLVTGVEYAAKFIRKRRRAADTTREIKHEVAVLALCDGCLRVVRLHEVRNLLQWKPR